MSPEEQPRPLGHRPTQAAALLSCTERTIYRYLKENKLRAKRIGGMTLITDESLVALMNGAPDWTPVAVADALCGGVN